METDCNIPMSTSNYLHCNNSFLHIYLRTNVMLFVSDNNQAGVVDAFDSTFRYLDDLLNIDNPYFEQIAKCKRV